MSNDRECGHDDGEGFCFGPIEPDCLATIPVVDNRYFFIRGCLELPIVGTQSTFLWLIWVSLSEKNFNRAADLWEMPERENEPPYFGWLSNRIPGYPDTTELKVNVHTLQVGRRPAIEVEHCDHPLAIEQRDGISRQRAQSLAKQVALEWG